MAEGVLEDPRGSEQGSFDTPLGFDRSVFLGRDCLFVFSPFFGNASPNTNMSNVCIYLQVYIGSYCKKY